MLILANFLRVYAGKVSVEAHTQEFLTERNNIFRTFFDHKMVTMSEYFTPEGAAKGVRQKRETEVEGFAMEIMLGRELDPSDTIPQLGLDDGQGYLKFLLTLKSRSEANNLPADQKQKKRRSLYKEGFSPKDYKLSGVKKILVLAMSPTIETHENVEAILLLLNISVLDFAFSADIKMQLILVGKMSASCSHACPYCNGSKPEWVIDSPRTTIGSLWQNYRDFMKPVAEKSGGGNEKKAKEFNIVVRRPLVTGEDETQILGGVFFFPELHVLIGIVGKMMMELETSTVFESEKAGRAYLVQWEKSCNVSRTAFHGSTNYNGNNAERLLDKVESLEESLEGLIVEGEKLALARKFISVFKDFRAVVHSCFGMRDLDPNYEHYIDVFSKSYRALNISVTVKVHLVEAHLAEFLKFFGETTLWDFTVNKPVRGYIRTF